MLPRIIKDEKDKVKVEKILELFYRKPGKKYGLDCKQSVYDSYSDFIAKYIESKDKVLDIGSGTWGLPATIAKKGFQVFGCDFFLEGISSEYETSKINTPFYLISGIGTSLPFKSDSFDVVTSLCVLEHVVSVENFLCETNRILKKGGKLIIKCPNWGGFNAPLRAIITLVFRRKPYWQYSNLTDSLLGLFRSFIWYFKILLLRDGKFILVFPKMKDNKISFRESDDDCVHVCHPLSFKKWLKKYNYRILRYNRYEGETVIARIFNTIFPSFATTNNIVAQKNGRWVD